MTSRVGSVAIPVSSGSTLIVKEYENTEFDQPYLCKTSHLEVGSLLTDSLIQEGMQDDESQPNEVVADDSGRVRDGTGALEEVILKEDAGGDDSRLEQTDENTPSNRPPPPPCQMISKIEQGNRTSLHRWLQSLMVTLK